MPYIKNLKRFFRTYKEQAALAGAFVNADSAAVIATRVRFVIAGVLKHASELGCELNEKFKDESDDDEPKPGALAGQHAKGLPLNSPNNVAAFLGNARASRRRLRTSEPNGDARGDGSPRAPRAPTGGMCHECSNKSTRGSTASPGAPASTTWQPSSSPPASTFPPRGLLRPPAPPQKPACKARAAEKVATSPRRSDKGTTTA